ncbi:MAG: 4-(cytidine 5'-diphospho)-2-C-methyl-D-erythritol kinase [Candidatus Omnitrophica bacterium]|nr:4-(cytidine 5'-diphospho)-2-C-methyl-D-erythritol kinase [Candidatus Omnitrophota bacterium]
MNCPQKQLRIRPRSSCAINVRPPAKLNLYLNILGKYRNGFHRIESIVQRIDLTDELTISYRRRPGFDMRCNDKSLESESNLCLQAARLITGHIGIKGGFRLDLIKHIPQGAGLGGGSSDAASTLLGINSLLTLGLTQKELYRLGARLGSDVNFFISQHSFAYLLGKGDNVIPLQFPAALDYCIVYPRLCLSTRKIYELTKVKLTKFLDNANIIYHALKHNDTLLLSQVMFNALEASAFVSSVRLQKHRALLKNLGFTMSGSGSAFFKVLHRPKEYAELKMNLPKAWKVYRARGL